MTTLSVTTHVSSTGKVFPQLDPLYRNPSAFRSAVQGAVTHFSREKIDGILAIEGRGLILGSVLSFLLGVPLIPARKAGKLPAAKRKINTSMGVMEVHADALQPGQKILVVDAVADVEHSMDGALQLIREASAQVAGILCLAKGEEGSSWEKSHPVYHLFVPVEASAFGSPLVSGKKMDFRPGSGFKMNVTSLEALKLPLVDVSKKDLLLKKIKDSIRTIPHFPKEGIMFRDITTIIQDPILFRTGLSFFHERYQKRTLHAVLGIESRGFIFGAPLAFCLGLPFIPVSKKGKSPGETVSLSYEIEYGHDEIEIPKDAFLPGQKVMVVDDLIATGGTAFCAGQLVEKLGAEVEEVACIIELPDLKGREKLKDHLYTLVEFEGD